MYLSASNFVESLSSASGTTVCMLLFGSTFFECILSLPIFVEGSFSMAASLECRVFGVGFCSGQKLLYLNYRYLCF